MRSSPRLDIPRDFSFVTIRVGGGGLPALAMDLGAVDKLRMAAIEGLKAIPRRGLEVGGILVGQVGNPASQDVTVSITEFISVSVNHRRGPSFDLDESDIALMHQTIREVEQRDGDGKELALGWWRTDTRAGGMKRSLEDDEAMRQIFGPGPALLLQIRPSIPDDFVCLMHILEGNTWHSSEEFPLVPQAAVHQATSADDPSTGIPKETSRKEEPLEPELAIPSPIPLPEPGRVVEASETGAAVERESQQTPIATPDFEEGGQPPPRQRAIPSIEELRAAKAPERKPTHSRQMPLRRVLAAVVFASLSFLAIFAIILYGRGWWEGAVTAFQTHFPSAYQALMEVGNGATNTASGGPAEPGVTVATDLPESPGIPFLLEAKAEPEGVRISWDPETLSAGSTSIGTIWVKDGNRETRIELTARELEQGTFLYRPESAQIRVRARLGNNAVPHVASLQVFGLDPIRSTDKTESPRPEREEVKRVERAESAPPRVPNRRDSPTRRFTPPRPDSDATQSAESVINEPEIQVSRAPGRVPAFTPPIDSGSDSLPAPAPPQTKERNIAVGEQAAPRKPLSDCKPELQVLAYYAHRSGLGILRGLQKLPFVPGDSDDELKQEFSAPVIMSHVCPTRASVGNAIIPVSVEFLVEIGENGKVESAKATGPAEYSPVSAATRQLLPRWKFYPARIGEYAAKSEVRIRVEFPAAYH